MNTKTKGKTNHAKAIVVALCALLFAVCFMAVGLSTQNGQALVAANPNPEINGGGGQSKNATPRAADDVYYTVADGGQQTGTLDTAIREINLYKEDNPNNSKSGTITLFQSITVSNMLQPFMNNTTLNLGAHNITLTGGQIILDGEGVTTLTITGNTGSVITGANSIPVVNGGSDDILSINNITVSTEKSLVIYNLDIGIININSGLVEAKGTSTAIKSGGTVNIKGGKVTAAGATDVAAGTATAAGIWNRFDGTVNVTGGTVTAAGNNGTGVFNASTGTVTVSGGTVEATATSGLPTAIYQYGTGTVTVSGTGVVSAKYGGAIKTAASSGGLVAVSGGTVSAGGGYNTLSAYGTTTLTVSGGTVENTGDAYAIGNDGTEAHITGGTITAASKVAIINLSGKPLYISSSTGGSPTITGGGGYAIETNVAIYGAKKEDTTKKYTGSNLPIKFTGTLAAGKTIVNNNTDITKFSLYGSSYWLKVSNGNLVATSSCTITFHYNGVLTNASKVVDIGDSVTRPADPSATGFIFGGWYTSGSYTTEFDFTNTPINTNTTIYAKFTLDVNSLSSTPITYNGQDHTVQASFHSQDTSYNYTYSWTKEDSSTEVSTTNTLTYKNVSQSGKYTCVIKAAKSGVTFTTTLPVTVTVNHTAAYNAFMSTHGAAIEYPPAALTYTQYSGALKNMLEEHGKLVKTELDQIADAGNTPKISALQAKYNAITEKKTAAQAAIAALGYTDDATAIAEIRANGIGDLKGKLTTATAAITAYTDFFTDKTNPKILTDLTGNANYTAVQALEKTYTDKRTDANTALGALTGKTAADIKNDRYTLQSVEDLLEAA